MTPYKAALPLPVRIDSSPAVDNSFLGEYKSGAFLGE
jgi:hypothetical protein